MERGEIKQRALEVYEAEMEPLERMFHNYNNADEVFLTKDGYAVKFFESDNMRTAAENERQLRDAEIAYPKTACIYLRENTEYETAIVQEAIPEEDRWHQLLQNPEEFVEDVKELIEKAEEAGIRLDTEPQDLYWDDERQELGTVDLNDSGSVQKEERAGNWMRFEFLMGLDDVEKMSKKAKKAKALI